MRAISDGVRGTALIILSALGFGLMPIFALLAYPHGISVSTLLLIRFASGSILLLAFVGLTGGFRRILWETIGIIFLLGGIGYTAQSTLYLEAIRHISPSLAALFLYTYPLFVAILSAVIDRQPITRRAAGSIALSLAGVVLVLGVSADKIDVTGILLAFGATAVYSGYIILGNRTVKRVPPILLSGMVMGFAAIGSAASGFAMGAISFRFDPQALAPAAGLVLVSTVLAIAAFFKGLDLLGPTRASIVSMTEPLFTLLGAALVFGDHLTLPQGLGGAAILAGAVLSVGAAEAPRNENKKGATHLLGQPRNDDAKDDSQTRP
jgi:drug/metabolite transporter (DMT)-like permease